MKDDLWFRAKRYGWGWEPVTWQGWVVVISFAILVILNGMRLKTDAQAPEFIFETFTLTAILLFICWKKGETPHWNWGDKKKD
jgi:hypothetical protein